MTSKILLDPQTPLTLQLPCTEKACTCLLFVGKYYRYVNSWQQGYSQDLLLRQLQDFKQNASF